jgi:hypothetical protein
VAIQYADNLDGKALAGVEQPRQGGVGAARHVTEFGSIEPNRDGAGIIRIIRFAFDPERRAADNIADPLVKAMMPAAGDGEIEQPDRSSGRTKAAGGGKCRRQQAEVDAATRQIGGIRAHGKRLPDNPARGFAPRKQRYYGRGIAFGRIE